VSVVISANFASRKILPCIYLGDANGGAPLKGPFEAEMIRLPLASPRQPFANSAAMLHALGYGPLPEGRNKIPCFATDSPHAPWTSYYLRQRLPDEIRALIAEYPNACLGVVCGYNNLLCVDIDTDDPDIINAILLALPPWTVAKRGSKGLTIFFRYRGRPDGICNRYFHLREADGKKSDAPFCEILWEGRKTTTPPSMHPKTGSPYIWVKSEHTLFNTPVYKLPEITEAHLEALEAALKPWAYEPPPPPEETGNILPRDYKPTDLEARRFRIVSKIILDRLANELKGMKETGRNIRLYCASREIGKYVHHKHLDESKVIEAFSVACNHNGLDKDDGGKNGVLATIRSGLRKSINDPLHELKDRPLPPKFPHRKLKDRKPPEPPPPPPLAEGGPGPAPAQERAATDEANGGNHADMTRRWYDGLSEAEHRNGILRILTEKTRAAIDTSPAEPGEQQQHFERVLQRLFRAGLDDNEVRRVTTGAAFARKFERGGLEAEIERARARWKEDGSPVRTERVGCGADIVTVEAEEEIEKKPAHEWGEPEPIEAPLHPVPPFDEDVLLPDGLRSFVVDEAYRMCCPIEYVAVSTIAISSSVIGAHCAIRPKRADNWLIVPNLWGAIVGEPSQMKSPAMNAAAKPLGLLIANAMAEYADAIAAAKGDTVVNEAKEKVIKKKIEQLVKGGVIDLAELKRLKDELKAQQTGSKEDEPVLRRFKTNDPTVEKLGELLRDNPGGLLYVRDELVGLIASWDKSGREGDRQFFLEAWNGTDDYDTDRIGRGTIIIPNLCVTIFGGMQPDKLTAYLEQASDALGNDGLLQRFQLLVYPDPIEWEYRDQIPNDGARKRVDRIFERLAAFDPAEWGASPKRPSIKFPYFFFDDAAQEVYIAWTTALHKKIEAESNPLIKQHLIKYDKLFPALALVFHMIGMALDPGRQPEISEDNAKQAAAWGDFLEQHARRCYGLLADGGLRSAKSLAKKLSERELPRNFNPDDFTARDVRRNRWQYLNGEKDVEAALDWLENKGWLHRRDVHSGPMGGRPTERYTVNPAVRKVSEVSAASHL